MESQKLLSGYLLFAFAAKPVRFQSAVRLAKLASSRLRNNGSIEDRRGEVTSSVSDKGRLSVERYGPAEVMLSDHKDAENPLEAWFRAKYAKAIRGYGFEVTSDTDSMDERLTLIGEQTRLYDGVPFSPVLMFDKLSKRTALVFHLWQCNQSNRIYVIQSIGSTDARSTVQKVAESIACH